MIGKKRKSSKYVFTLKNVNTEIIDKKYNIKIKSNITNVIKQPDNTTKLTELTGENLPDKRLQVISFLDESKKIYQCNISMIDFRNGKDINSIKYNCYWCRHPFNSRPIGCPISYISSKSVKNYHSEVSKDNYIIKENITKYKNELFDSNKFIFSALKEKNKPSYNFIINKNSFYSCDGVFCSFNCGKAFIKDNKYNRTYEKSDYLLLKLYNEITGSKNIVINPAPSWRLLEEYGGTMTINQFRESFNKLSYEYQGIIENEKLFKSVGTVYEEKINF